MPNVLARMTEEEKKKLVDDFLTNTAFGRIVAGLLRNQPADSAPPTPEKPDNPPCDGCKEPFTGTDRCSQCQSVFYCSRECQRVHWRAQHRGECMELKRQNEETARRILQDFKEFRDWRALDVSGAYKAAVKQGLHDKIREVLALDNKNEIIARYQNSNEVFVGYTSCVMSVLFRGRRAEGNADAKRPTVNCVDGPRIVGYVKSHPDALDTWLQASVQWTRTFADPVTRILLPHLHKFAFAVTDSVWVSWAFVFTDPKASRAILLPFPIDGESNEQRRKRDEAHARGIVSALAEAFRLVTGIFGLRNDIKDPLLQLETKLLEVAAMVHVWTQEYGIGIDVERILNLSMEAYKHLFRHISIPLAKRTIKKGGLMITKEILEEMAISVQGMGPRFN